MIEEKDIKVGGYFSVRREDLENLTKSSEWIDSFCPKGLKAPFVVKVVDILKERCEIQPVSSVETSIDVCIKGFAEIANVYTNKVVDNTEQVSHPSHYSWLREKCLVEPIDICRHLDFNIGCAVKYLLRKGKKEEGLSETEQRIQDLNKARFYIEDEITRVLGGKLK